MLTWCMTPSTEFNTTVICDYNHQTIKLIKHYISISNTSLSSDFLLIWQEEAGDGQPLVVLTLMVQYYQEKFSSIRYASS